LNPKIRAVLHSRQRLGVKGWMAGSTCRAGTPNAGGAVSAGLNPRGGVRSPIVLAHGPAATFDVCTADGGEHALYAPHPAGDYPTISLWLSNGAEALSGTFPSVVRPAVRVPELGSTASL